MSHVPHQRSHLTALLAAVVATAVTVGACSSDEARFVDQGTGSDGGGDDGKPGDVKPGDDTAPTVDQTTSPANDVAAPDAAPPADGKATSDAAVDAGQGDETLNTGDESGDQPAPGEVGAPCTADGDCTDHPGSGTDDSQGAICLTEPSDKFPGGYCSFLCSLPATLNYGCNAAGGVYVPYSSSWGDGYCYHACGDPTDCRVGYRCVDGACMPDCAQLGCKVGTCDAQKKVCLAQ